MTAFLAELLDLFHFLFVSHHSAASQECVLKFSGRLRHLRQQEFLLNCVPVASLSFLAQQLSGVVGFIAAADFKMELG